jgi:hypothetical protein
LGRVYRMFQTRKNNGLIPQSKGKAIMVKCPKPGDIVYVSCAKLRILKCEVLTPFLKGTSHQTDKFNINERIGRFTITKLDRPHTKNKEFLIMKIIEVFDNPIYLRGHQRTWITYKPPIDINI